MREGAHIKHCVSPGVDTQIDSQNPNDVQHKASFHLEEQTHSDQFTV